MQRRLRQAASLLRDRNIAKGPDNFHAYRELAGFGFFIGACLFLNHKRMRRVLRVITAPIFSSRKRMVVTWARANSVPRKPRRLKVSKAH